MRRAEDTVGAKADNLSIEPARFIRNEELPYTGWAKNRTILKVCNMYMT